MLRFHKTRFAISMANLRKQAVDVSPDIAVVNLFLLLLVAGITFFPLIFVGFTTRDDSDVAVNFGWTTNLFETASLHAELQGRFTFLWAYPLLRVPYLIDSQVWYVCMRLGAMIVLLLALYFAIRIIFRSAWIGLASIVFFLAFVQNGWDHNALTSYPFAFNVYGALFLISLGMFAKSIDRESVVLAVISGLLYFFALGIELFVLFFPLYIAVLLSRDMSGESILRRLASRKEFLLSITLPLALYLMVYFLWRIAHPSGYDGNSLNGFSMRHAAQVVIAYSLSAFPLASLHFMVSPADQVLFTESVGLSEMLSEMNATHFVKPAVVGFILYRLMRSAHFIVPQTRTLASGAAVSFLGIFLPNLLLGFVQKHQGWVAAGSYSYLYTYYSFISVVVFAALVLAYIISKSQFWRPGLRLVLALIAVFVVVGVSFAVEVRNQYIAFDQKLSHRKWQLMDQVIKSPAFAEIPDGSTVVAPSLAAHYRGIAIVSADYWSKYTKYKSGKQITFVDDKCNDGAPCYSLVFRQESHSDNQFVILATASGHDASVSVEMTIYTMPERSGSVLVGAFRPGKASPELEINGAAISNIGSGGFSFSLPHTSGVGAVQTTRLTGNIDVFPDLITISRYSVIPRLQPISIDLGEGFYGWETGPGQPMWAWSKGGSELLITNLDRKTLVVNVMFEATSLEGIRMNTPGKPAQSFSVIPGTYVPIEFTINAPPGITRIPLQPDRPAIQPGGGDVRFLSFAVRNLRFHSQ